MAIRDSGMTETQINVSTHCSSVGIISVTFEEDVEYFNSINAELAKDHKGKFVLIKDKANWGIFSSFEDAHKEALRKFGVVDVLIAQIGEEQPLNYMATAV